MGKYDDILKLANDFELESKAQAASRFLNHFNLLKNNILTSANGALSAAKMLLREPKYQKSEGLNKIKNNIPNIINSAKQLTTYNIGNMLPTVQRQLQNLLFYTEASNAGSGYDPATTVQMKGYSSPAALLKATKQNLEKMNTFNKANPRAGESMPKNKQVLPMGELRLS